MKKLIIIGGHGNGTVVASTVVDLNRVRREWEILGFLNDREAGPINGFPVLGPITREGAAPYLEDPDVFFFYSLISVKLNFKSLGKLNGLGIPRERFATVVHPTAVVSEFAQVGRGVCIQPFVNVGPNAVIGDHIHVFAQAMIGHGSHLENYSYVANNACVGAHVVLKEGAYLGTNCTLLENVTIGEWGLVGIGAVVLKNVPAYTKVVGNPAREIGRVE